MQVTGSTTNRMQSPGKTVAGVAGKSRKVRQAKASTIEATQPIRSACVRSDSMRILAMSSKGPPLDVLRSWHIDCLFCTVRQKFIDHKLCSLEHIVQYTITHP